MSKDTKKTREKSNREICAECTDCIEEPQYYRSQCRTHKDFEKLQRGPDKNKRFWELMNQYTASDKISIQQHIVKHVEYNLARTRCSMDNNSCYQAVALSVRDKLIEANNDARRHHLKLNSKRAFYFSIEYLPGRSLRNALINLDIEDNYRNALEELGYKLEDLYDEEQDPGLGNGGLGRLASCFLDSAATLEYPIWGYGIRYNYGIFKQKIVNGGQCEVPDYWLSDGYPWEIRRSDVGFRIRFYGKVTKKKDEKGRERVVWEDGEEVHALGYDQLVPGFNTFNTITLRLWRSRPTKEFDFASFTHGDYYKALQEKQKAEFISSVLYPNDTSPEGKELRLKQQYFFVSASLQDILRRFRFVNDDWNLLPEKTAIQLNDTHPTIAIVELLRLLIDLEGLEWDNAWNIVTKVFSYTNHTVMPEALEAWKEDMMRKLLPRHLELIHIINDKFLKEAEEVFPNNKEKLKALSIIDGDSIRMANLAIVGSHAINGVAEIHTQLLKDTIFKEFYEMWPNKFQNKTNGVTHRRWVGVANPGLAQLYTDELGTKDWLSNLEMVKKLLSKLDDCDFRKKWNDVKQKNKRRLLEWIQDNIGVTLREDSIFDIMIKRIHEYKRQLLNVLYVIYRYMKLKDASPEERKKSVPRSVLIGGKAAPGYEIAKSIIRLIVTVAQKINEDPDTSDYLKLVFLPNYCVSNAELYIPGADVTQSISAVGTEASGTSNMKFCMNGALLLGTVDGANVEIAEQVGEENMFIFGARIDELGDITKKLGKSTVGDFKCKEWNQTIEAIQGGMFGDHDEIKKLIEHVLSGTDKYLIAYDFRAYIEAQEKIDKLYQNREEWTKKSIITALNCSKFSSDRTVREYAEQIWNIKPAPVPKPKKDQYETWHIENRQAQAGDGRVVQGRKLFGKDPNVQQESRNSLTGGA